jgi:hypothetical protein
MNTRIMSAVVIAAVVVAGSASAEITSRTVIATFKGQLVVSKAELSEAKTDKDTIAKINADKLKEVVGETTNEVTHWYFHYAAFVNSGGNTKLKMEFYRDGKTYVADKRLENIDPKSAVIFGDINISEDDGLTKGKSYVVKVVTDKDVVVASTPLIFK